MSALKRKRVSKKNKASWRKHVDIKDVEEFLEDQRLEERIGKAETKPDDELFTVDTTGSTYTVLTTRQKRKENAKKPPRSLAILENTSKVPDPLVQRDKVKQKKNGRDIVAEILAPRKSSRVVQSIRDRKKFDLKIKHQIRNKNVKIFQNNLWDGKEGLDHHPEFQNDWITKNLAVYNLQKTGRPLVKTPGTTHKKTTRAKALDLPHPGMSYNPSFKDHQDLINTVLERETKVIKEEQHLKRVTTDMFSKLTPEQRDLEYLKQAAAGIRTEEGDTESDEEGKGSPESDSDTYHAVNAPVENKKKDRKARRKQREQRELLQERMQLKRSKKQTTDIHRLRVLKAEVLTEEQETGELMKRRKITEKKRLYEPRRLAKTKYVEPEFAVNMAEDIAGNLRNVKPESNLLTDRFKSLQKRNILPASIDVGTHKRRKIKRFARSSHKELPQQPKKNKK